MTRDGISKKRRQDDQRRKRASAAGALVTGAKSPPKPISVAARRSRPSAGFVEAAPELLPPMHYPLKRVSLGKRQVPGRGSPT